jgi:hypothetical protein
MPAKTYTTHTTHTASGGTFSWTTLDRPEPDCAICGEDGHTADVCPEDN